MTNTGPTVIIGDLGVSPTPAITGFPPGIVVGGTTHAADAVALQAQSDTTTAYNNLAGQACDTELTGQDLGGQTLVAGVYCFSTSAQLTGTLTLDAQGDPSAVWVFQIGSTLTTASNSSVLFINGAQACNVFWQIGSSATIGTGTTFVGNILALTSITLNTNAALSGRALARNGAVTMDSNTISISACAEPPIIPIPPTLSKAFNPATIDEGGVSTLTITLVNAEVTDATLTAPLIDNLPSGVVVAPTPNAGTTCGGLVTATPGGSTVTLASGSVIPAGGSCTVTVDVTSDTGGSYFNSLAIGSLQTDQGANAAPAIATLTVITPPDVIPPALSKAFSPASINEGEVSTLTITLINAEVTDATLTAPLIDNLPSGLVVAPTPNAGSTCGGSVTAVAGGSTVTLASGSVIPAGGSCTVTVDVTSDTGGSYINSLAAGALQTDQGANPAPAIATLVVITPAVNAPPTLVKEFSPATMNVGEVSTLTITLVNPGDTDAILTAPLIDNLPGGLVVAPTPNAGSTCGGSVTAVAGGSTVTLVSGSVIPANGSCTVTVDVTSDTGGSYINSLAAGALQTDQGVNAAPAVATVTVITPPGVVPPTLGKAFNPITINTGGVSTLTITLINAGDMDAILTAPLIDNLPSGLVVAPVPNAGSTCGGSVTAVAGGSTVTLASGSVIPANGSCTVTVDVTSDSAGSYFNSLAAGALQTDQGVNAAPAIVTLIVTSPTGVIIPPTLSKSFSPDSINPGEVSTLTITLYNSNSTVANLTAPLIDYLPKGVVIAPIPNASTTCGSQVTLTWGSKPSNKYCGAKIMAIPGSSKVILTGGSIPANGSCTITVDVIAKKKGSYCNKLYAGALKTDLGNNTTPASATLIVTYVPAKKPPTLSKAFSPATIDADGVSTLTITLNNPNSSVATLTAPLTDALPSGVVVANPANAGSTCGGSVTAAPGGSQVTLASGSVIPANGSCTVTVDVTAKKKGSYCNKLYAGALKTDLGNNTTSAYATLTVTLPLWKKPHYTHSRRHGWGW